MIVVYKGQVGRDVRVSAIVTLNDGTKVDLGQLSGKGRGLFLRLRQWWLRRKLRRGWGK